MSWNNERYLKVKKECQNNISKGFKTANHYMQEYKDCIKKEDYEGAKAITDVLNPLNYYTADTHIHIKELD